MQRRVFTQALATSAVAAPLLWPQLASAQAALREGPDYRRLSRAAPVEAPAGKIEVVEFFSYTCVHCFNFVPVFNSWKQTVAADVVVKRCPVGFNASFEPLQRLFYTLEAMGSLDTHHDRVFKSIHEDRQRLNNLDAMASGLRAMASTAASLSKPSTPLVWLARLVAPPSCKMPTRWRAPRRWV